MVENSGIKDWILNSSLYVVKNGDQFFQCILSSTDDLFFLYIELLFSEGLPTLLKYKKVIKSRGVIV